MSSFWAVLRNFFGPSHISHFVSFELPGLTEHERNDPKVLERQAHRLAGLLKGRGLNVTDMFGVPELRILSIEFDGDISILVDLGPTKSKGEWSSQVAIEFPAILEDARRRQFAAMAAVEAQLDTTLRLDFRAERIEWFDGRKRVRRGEGFADPSPLRQA
jgi:hypothetical protein